MQSDLGIIDGFFDFACREIRRFSVRRIFSFINPIHCAGAQTWWHRALDRASWNPNLYPLENGAERRVDTP